MKGAVMQESFGCAVANRFCQLLDDDSDPFDILREAESRRQQRKQRGEAAAAAKRGGGGGGVGGRGGAVRRESQKERKQQSGLGTAAPLPGTGRGAPGGGDASRGCWRPGCVGQRGLREGSGGIVPAGRPSATPPG